MMKYFRLALSFLSIIPVGKMGNIPESNWASSVVFYPICGYIIGIAVLLPAFLLSLFFKVDPILLAAITVSLLAIITGALHLDGFADLCDGFFCPVDSKERRIEIMHDSHIGSFGVVGLILLLLIKFASLFVLFKHGNFISILAVIILARFFIVLLAAISKYPSDKGIGKFVIGKIPERTIILSFIFIIPCLFSLQMMTVALVLLLIVILLKTLSNKLIGGVTGDVLGTCCEICETVGLLMIALFNLNA